MNDPESEARNEGWHEGYSAGLLDAAKIALTTPCPGRKGMNPIADVSHAIADAIRARAAEVSGNPGKLDDAQESRCNCGRDCDFDHDDSREVGK